ncbi:MAG: DUF3052 domain-containing protein [Gammaproteobacteria bacterium]
MAAGYSGTPLAAKLGIKAGMAIRAVNAPAGYGAWVTPLPGGARIARSGAAKAALVHHFATRRAELASALASYRRQLGDSTPVWVSWPKKSAKVATDITEDVIRAVALPLGYVDIKVCAVSDTWSGLKLVVRRELRGKEVK